MNNSCPASTSVLLVEDHDAMRSALSHWLITHFPRIELHEAGSIPEALRVIEQSHVDVVLMDICLPGMDGLDGTRELRRHNGDVKVVAISTYDTRDLSQAAAEAGAIAFVPKARLLDELIALMTSLVSRENGNR
jgi:DNA-binding NarL/FixJ family response regulator